MRVLVAGASGAIGRALLPLLMARRHVVAGLIRNPAGVGTIRDLGGEPIVADALDLSAIAKAFERFRPDAVVHQLTALPAALDLRNFDGVFATTNRLRTEGTSNLLEASRRVGVRRFVAQSFCGWTFARRGGLVKTEDAPLIPILSRRSDALWRPCVILNRLWRMPRI